MLRRCRSLAFLLALLATPATAAADITGFLGVNRTPSPRAVRGLAVGGGLLVVGFEIEYAQASEELDELSPQLRTIMANGLVQTPFPIAGLQLYATAGGGGYRETLAGESETNVAGNIGGGVKISIAGPLRLRLDYRVFTLRGEPRHPRPHRLYAGLNLKF